MPAPLLECRAPIWIVPKRQLWKSCQDPLGEYFAVSASLRDEYKFLNLSILPHSICYSGNRREKKLAQNLTGAAPVSFSGGFLEELGFARPDNPGRGLLHVKKYVLVLTIDTKREYSLM